MTRRLIDYRKLDHKLASLLIESYPHGYGDEDVITFKDINGNIVEAVELRTEDTLYLVKISKSLSNFIANFEENIEKELEVKSPKDIMTNSHMGHEMESDFKITDDEF